MVIDAVKGTSTIESVAKLKGFYFLFQFKSHKHKVTLFFNLKSKISLTYKGA